MSFSIPVPESDSGYYSGTQESDHKHYQIPKERFYNMNHKKRGPFIIINNYEFSASTGMFKRDGSSADNNNLETTFEELGFDVIKYVNQTVNQMEGIIKAASKMDYSDADCFGMAILSHGDSGGAVYGTDGMIKFESLIDPVSKNKVKSLIGKPKLFFIQACRGLELDDGVETKKESSCEEDAKKNKEEEIYKTPAEADFLYSYSTAPGYASFRNKKDGSWYVQAMKSVLDRYAKNYDLIHLLTIVSCEVATKWESKSAKYSYNRKKQIPTFNSMLTKFVQF